MLIGIFLLLDQSALCTSLLQEKRKQKSLQSLSRISIAFVGKLSWWAVHRERINGSLISQHWCFTTFLIHILINIPLIDLVVHISENETLVTTTEALSCTLHGRYFTSWFLIALPQALFCSSLRWLLVVWYTTVVKPIHAVYVITFSLFIHFEIKNNRKSVCWNIEFNVLTAECVDVTSLKLNMSWMTLDVGQYSTLKTEKINPVRANSC